MFKKKEAVQREEFPPFKIEIQPQITIFPDTPKDKTNVQYALIPPYAYANIFWDTANKELIYYLQEPDLNEDEQKTLSLLEEGIKELTNISYIAVKKGETVIEYLEKNVKVLIQELKLKVSSESYLKIMYYIYRNFVGLNEIEPLMWDYYIEDVECNGIDVPLYVVHRKYRNLRTNIMFRDAKKLTSFVEKLAQKTGHYISYADPLLDAALPDNSRVNATFTEDISTRGPTFSIRKFTKIPWSPTRLMQFGTISPQMLAYLWILIEYEMNIMIIGGTSSGKTTFLNALTTFIPPQARIISIEDTRELALQHENWLPSVAREGVGLSNLVGQKYGEVSLFTLLKESFRQNPDYVIVGEIRGQESYVLFQGMASVKGNEKILVRNDNHLKKIEIAKLINKNLKKIKVLSFNPKTNKVEALPIKSVVSHKHQKELYEIKTETGKGVLTTGNHSLFLNIQNKIIPTEVKDLRKGDTIATINLQKQSENLEGERITRIKKIRLDNPEPVYDISVENTRNFINAQGILLHNSGHPSFGTMHANSVDTMIKRLGTPPINLSASLVETLDVVCVMIQTKVGGKLVRRISEVVEVIEVKENQPAVTNTPFIWNPQKDTFFFKTQSHVFKKLFVQQGINEGDLQKEFKLRTELLIRLYQKKVFDFIQVRDTIKEYYKDPSAVLARFGII